MKNILIVLTLMITSMASGQSWEVSWESASQKAKEKNLNIVLVFSGSDWCAPCIKLDREILGTAEFQSLSKDSFVMLKADFPRKSKNALEKNQQIQNNLLAERYNQNGYFPSVVVLNSEGKFLGRLGYEKTTPELYFKQLQDFEK